SVLVLLLPSLIVDQVFETTNFRIIFFYLLSFPFKRS
ncbi:unnamed protein product, partial [Arabidopsis halleri]